MTGYIYCHTSPSGKKYIGQTCSSLKKRWNNGNGYRSSPIFYKAIQKYGWENISHEVLEIIEGSEEEVSKKLNERELYWISECNTTSPNGYNIELGGGGAGKRRIESLQKQSSSKLKEKTPSKEDLIFYYQNQKKTLKETGKILGISSGAVSNWLDWYNISKHHFGPQEDKIKDINKDELYNLYIIQNLSQQKIADMFKVSESTIRRRLKKYEILSKPSHRYKKEAIK